MKTSTNIGLNIPEGNDVFNYKTFLADNLTKLDDHFMKIPASQEFIAAEGQTVFNLASSYTMGANVLSVEVDGVPQELGTGFTETSPTSITLAEGVPAGATISVTTFNLPAGVNTQLAAMQTSLAENASKLDGTRYNALYPPIPLVACKGDGSTDDASAIENLANSLGKGELVFPIGKYVIGRTVQIPIGVKIVGTSGRKGGTEFYPKASGTYTENYLFFLNISTGAPSTWVTQYPNISSGGAYNVGIINNVDGQIAVPIVPKLNGFKFAGSYQFEGIRYEGVSTLIGKPSLYTDKVSIKDVYGRWRTNTTDYLINLPGLGDSYELRQIVTAYVGTEVAVDSANWSKGIYLGQSRGADVFGLINGIHTFEGGQIIDIHGCHIEGGRIEIIDTEATVRDNLFYCEQWEKTPRLQFKSNSSIYRNRYKASAIRNIFIQDATLHSGWQDTLVPDIMVHTACHLTLEDNVRQVGTSASVGKKQFMGIVICDTSNALLPDFNNYSHLLSPERIRFTNNAIDINAKTRDFRGSFGGFETPVFDTSYGVNWKGSATTYYYQAQLVIDPIRLIGRNATGAEVSIAIASGNAIVELPINWSGINENTGVMLRVYRGTATGSYDKYIDIPIVACRSLFDDGISLSGFVWKSRATGAVDTLNNTGTSGSAIYNDGVIRIFSDYTGAPTVGTWKPLDTIELTAPFDDSANSRWRTSWFRLSDGTWQPRFTSK